MFDLFVERYAKPHKKPSSLKADKDNFERYFSQWKNRQLSSLSHNDVIALHSKVGKTRGILLPIRFCPCSPVRVCQPYASMKLLMQQELLLSEVARRRALETLERWSELYRHGLEASGMIAQRGEVWLHEADQRLKLTVQELRKLDSTSEALATEKREDKARYLPEDLDNISNLILPITDVVKVPIRSDKKLNTV